jgi:deoxycytidylate deaminase
MSATAALGVSARVEPIQDIRRAQVSDIGARRTDELIIAFVGPVGSGCTMSANFLSTLLKNEFGYEDVVYHRVSKLIESAAYLVGGAIQPAIRGAERARMLQDTGNELRRAFRSDYLIAKVIEKIADHRLTNGGQATSASGSFIPEPKRWAHLIDSIKNPAELALLRDVYGDMLWVFGIFAPEEVRRDRLKFSGNWTEQEITELFEKDNKQEWDYGQGVRDTFFQADLFVRNDGENDERLHATLRRHLMVMFGAPVHTPTNDESAMYAAYAAAGMSACLSRQVGAAVISSDGELIGVGWNDVPKYGGGLYSPEDKDGDNRCFKWGGKVCHNDMHKESLYQEIYEALGRQFLKDDATLENVRQALKGTDVRQLIEYSRAVHAEMAALISVARSGKPGLRGGTLFCTTFPCHSCARHLIAAGVEKVIYIEPYPKSLALDLHRDATSANGKDRGKKMLLQQYEGVSPRNLLRLFKPTELSRKKDGRLVDFQAVSAHPLGSVSVDDFSTHEKRVLSELKRIEDLQAAK